MPGGNDPPAAIAADAPAIRAHDPEPVWPIPTPIVMFDGGPAAVSVTSTSPVAETVKGPKLLPFTCTVPVSVSVVFGIVGVVADVELEPLLQADAARASEMTTTGRE